jgi:2-oxoglutarate/2-oxoacid ferredoxin oxidoreductase subunit beta
MNINDFKSNDEIAWCPGCGDFGILVAVKKALVELNRPPREVVLVSGIGQAAKLPHYIRANCFNGLHGRALPCASAIKMANRELCVIVTTGDGDCYGEGGNHFIHAIRRNTDITVIVHDNQVYGLTKGQASPTTDEGTPTKVYPGGVIQEPFKSLAVAIANGCGFVSRGFSGKPDHLAQLITEAVKFKGFSLVEVLQPCVTYNHINTHSWYSSRVYNVNESPSYDTGDKLHAIEKALEWGEKIPIGILYRHEKPSYEEKSGLNKIPPIVDASIENVDIRNLLDDFR